jgi:transcriptional regulator with XRE-family HTH domain
MRLVVSSLSDLPVPYCKRDGVINPAVHTHMLSKLRNYLRTYRRRSGLTQSEVAFLLGCKDGTIVSRYERGAREPRVKTLLTFEVVLATTSRNLFAGIYQKAEAKVARRAKLLARRLRKTTLDRRTLRKLAALRSISTP